MLKEAIDRLLGVGRDDATAVPAIIDIDKRKFTRQQLVRVAEPQPAILSLHTLDGLIAYIATNKDGLDKTALYLQVESPDTVMLWFKVQEPDLLRWQIANSQRVKSESFNFGNFMDQEKFLIEIQSKFVDSEEKDRLLQLASAVTSGTQRVGVDDGIGQEVTVKTGVSLKQMAKVANPFKLSPFRTFPEVTQPTSPFICRVRNDQNPEMALFEADGGRWKVDAIQTIGAYLKDKVGEIPVLA